MNGARTTFMRRGYLLTALSALLLLAASAGTASAQVTVTGPMSVAEGGTATYTVNVKGVVPSGQSEDSLTVTLTDPRDNGAAQGTATAGENTDLSLNLGGLIVQFCPAS